MNQILKLTTWTTVVAAAALMALTLAATVTLGAPRMALFTGMAAVVGGYGLWRLRRGDL